ncbi:Ku protein [Streptomyces sp. NPDC046197]|uniref:non-homologous end joining protein Ku n=1 Tax=Streptomyces sp. NPDC046197 TaxID=3154337 RepID=UPI0033C1E2E1
MPRAVWSGAISFGLVTVPVGMVSATEDHSVRFHQYHEKDMGRVRVRKFCEVEDREVAADEIGKGYEISKGQIIPITDDELGNLPLPTAKAIEIEGFLPLEAIDPLHIRSGHYLQPAGQVANKPYRLLVEALGRSSRVAIAKFAWSGRERLGMLRVRDDVIVLHQLLWPDEVRSAAEVTPPPADVDENEIRGALALMDTMTRDDLEGEEFHDHYTEALEQIIEAKREHREPPEVPEAETEPGKVLDLMAALNASVQKVKASRGEGGEAEVHELPRTSAAAAKTAKKQPAKKAAAQKKATEKSTSGKKAATKKAPAKKPRRTA